MLNSFVAASLCVKSHRVGNRCIHESEPSNIRIWKIYPPGKLGEWPPKAHASSSELAINPGEYDEGEYAGESPLRLYSYPGRDRLSNERLFGLGELCEYGLDPGLP